MVENEYSTELHSKLEPIVIDKVCEPILSLVPESVAPNTLSAVSVSFAAVGFVLAALAPDLEPTHALWARIGSAFCIWGFMISDCLDGMQARRTGRCTRFGAFLDHWLDAVAAPLAASGLILTLELDPFMTAAAVVTTVMVYNCQLVIQHHTRRFIHPPTSGLDAQLLLGVAMMAFGVLLFLYPRETVEVNVFVNVFALGAIAGALRNLYFLYERMDQKQLLDHLKLVGVCLALSIPYWLSMMSTTAYCVLISFVSFRICGSYVLMTGTNRSYGGLDWALLAWAPVMVAVNLAVGEVNLYGSWSLQDVLPYLACLHALSLNLVELARSLDVLRDESGERRTALG